MLGSSTSFRNDSAWHVSPLGRSGIALSSAPLLILAELNWAAACVQHFDNELQPVYRTSIMTLTWAEEYPPTWSDWSPMQRFWNIWKTHTRIVQQPNILDGLALHTRIIWVIVHTHKSFASQITQTITHPIHFLCKSYIRLITWVSYVILAK